MAVKKPAFEKLTLPRGTAVFPKLTVADEYKGKSTYSTGIKYLKADVQPILDKLTALAEEHVAKVKAELKEAVAAEKGAKKVAAKKKLDDVTLHVPFKADVDDNGDETDYVILKAKMNDRFTKDGKVTFIKPDLYDAATPPKKITKEIDVWGGSEIKVAVSIMPTYVDASGACGVTLRLQGVQIITLRQGGQSAESMGFGGEEGGFSGDDLPASAPAKTDDVPAGDGAEEEQEQF